MENVSSVKVGNYIANKGITRSPSGGYRATVEIPFADRETAEYCLASIKEVIIETPIVLPAGDYVVIQLCPNCFTQVVDGNRKVPDYANVCEVPSVSSGCDWMVDGYIKDTGLQVKLDSREI